VTELQLLMRFATSCPPLQWRSGPKIIIMLSNHAVSALQVMWCEWERWSWI